MKLSMAKPEREAAFWYDMTSPNNSTAFQHENAKSLSLSVSVIIRECDSLLLLFVYKIGQMEAVSLCIILIFARSPVLDLIFCYFSNL